MRNDRTHEKIDTKTAAVMLAIIAGVIGLLGYAFSTASLDVATSDVSFDVAPPQQEEAKPQPVQTVHTAHAELQSLTSKLVRPASAKTTQGDPESWHADDSAQGSRPDAAH
jgi:hypothetical protein